MLISQVSWFHGLIQKRLRISAKQLFTSTWPKALSGCRIPKLATKQVVAQQGVYQSLPTPVIKLQSKNDTVNKWSINDL
jgi:hypothetical protein